MCLQSSATKVACAPRAEISRMPTCATVALTADLLIRIRTTMGKQFRMDNQRGTTMTDASNASAPTQFIETSLERYAYRRFGRPAGRPLLCLQHFTGTLDNWDPAVTDPLALDREVILFESAGLGRSTGSCLQASLRWQHTRSHSSMHLDCARWICSDSLSGGMVAQQLALRTTVARETHASRCHRARGRRDVMHLEKPQLKRIIDDPSLPGLQRLVKLFFTPSTASQAAGEAFIARLAKRKDDREPISGPAVAHAQTAAFRAWEQSPGERFAKLRGDRPALPRCQRHIRRIDPGQKFLHAG